jgi:hypothetical protein
MEPSVSQVLARVATGVHEVARGPDVSHRIAVKRSWLERGDSIELTLPRNLACAACSGGGCDRCERAGAISVRERGVVADTLIVPLPKRSAEELANDPVVVLRVPEQGGVGPPEVDMPRGLLLLRITAAAKTDAGIKRVRIAEGRASLPPREARKSGGEAEPVAPSSESRPRQLPIPAVWVLLAAAWLALVLYAAATLPK